MTGTKAKKASLGCDQCRAFHRTVIERGFCPPHPDMVCGKCGTREASVHRSVAAEIRREKKAG